MSKNKSKRIFLILLLILAGAAAYYLYQRFFTGVQLQKNYSFVYIETGDDADDIAETLEAEQILSAKEKESFEWLAKQMDLANNIHYGKYRITNGMTLRQIVNLFKYNKQEAVKLTINSQLHELEDFAEYAADKLEMNASEIEEFLKDDRKLQENFGLDPDNAFALLLPQTLEVSWSVSVDELFSLLKKKYDAVWTKERKLKAERVGYSVPEIITLASIVQSESAIESEQRKIAGVYLNRLKKNMLLQADPTLKFANKKWDAQRVYDVDKEINSPYNTYKFKGLPPGPICVTSVKAIDATLNHAHHNYIFFCASYELNGYSDYSETYEQHKRYAEKYQRMMNKKGIK